MAYSASTKRARSKAKQGGATTIRLTPQDREHISRVIAAGWAISATGAIRFALRSVAEQVKAA